MKQITRRTALMATAAMPALAIPAIAEADDTDAELDRLVDRAYELDEQRNHLGIRIDELDGSLPAEIRYAARVQIGWRTDPYAPNPSAKSARLPRWATSESDIDEAEAELVRIGGVPRAEEWNRMRRELRELQARRETAIEANGVAAMQRRYDAIYAEQRAIEDKINSIPAVTVRGYKAKLRNFYRLVPNLEEDGTLVTAVLRSLMQDAGLL